MQNVNEKKKPSRKDDAAGSDERRENDGRSSLDRLANLTRRILRVPKTAVQESGKARSARRG